VSTTLLNARDPRAHLFHRSMTVSIAALMILALQMPVEAASVRDPNERPTRLDIRSAFDRADHASQTPNCHRSLGAHADVAATTTRCTDRDQLSAPRERVWCAGVSILAEQTWAAPHHRGRTGVSVLLAARRPILR
jgi:hypothetical protein